MLLLESCYPTSYNPNVRYKKILGDYRGFYKFIKTYNFDSVNVSSYYSDTSDSYQVSLYENRKKEEQNIVGHMTSLNNSKYGHAFFFKKKKMTEYVYFIGEKDYSRYTINFNKKERITSIKGTPYIHFSKLSNDSILLFFSSFMYDSLVVYDLTKDKSKIPVFNSTIAPYTVYIKTNSSIINDTALFKMGIECYYNNKAIRNYIVSLAAGNVSDYYLLGED